MSVDLSTSQAHSQHSFHMNVLIAWMEFINTFVLLLIA